MEGCTGYKTGKKEFIFEEIFPIFDLQTVDAGLMVVKVIPAEAAPRYIMAYSGVLMLCIA